MQRLFLFVVVLFVVAVVGSVSMLIFTAIAPYLHTVALLALVVVGIGLLCVVCMFVAYTINRIGIWNAERRRHQLYANVIVAGEVVACPMTDGSIVHLSAMHEAAKVPHPTVKLREVQPPSTEATVLELFDKGVSLRNICQATGLTYYQVQKITSAKCKSQ